MFGFQREAASAYYVLCKDFFSSEPLWTVFDGLCRYYEGFSLFWQKITFSKLKEKNSSETFPKFLRKSDSTIKL